MDKSVRAIEYEDHLFIAQMCGESGASDRYPTAVPTIPEADRKDIERSGLHVCSAREAPLRVEYFPERA